MSVTFISGGTGTPKLLDGAREILNPEEISVAVNVADDCVVGGNLVCPDIDTVLYTLSDRIDRNRWWGVRDDTERVHGELLELSGNDNGGQGVSEPEVRTVEANREIGRERCFSGASEFMTIGDSDRALHVYRTGLLDEGYSLTDATSIVADTLGVRTEVVPVTDDPVSSWVETPDGWMHFQEFWVARGGGVEVQDVEFRGCGSASATPEILDSLDHPVIIGPSNPVTSVGPFLEFNEVREGLRDTFVVAVSPFVGGDVVSGPAADLMDACGVSADSEGVYQTYSGFVDVLVVDDEDPDVDCRVVEMDTVMDDRDDAVDLSRELFEVAGLE
ncbi:MAG: 2-phospho-L-lactate transferase [Halobacteria archaeon]